MHTNFEEIIANDSMNREITNNDTNINIKKSIKNEKQENQ